ncbi:hypothetical protein ACFWWT_37570 [Streptomyces sp. NPDC058676]|uniref:hypothetical protein n=1 Tax=unclassified Streptomyces TaxID=2593676 RepID=UPI003648513D
MPENKVRLKVGCKAARKAGPVSEHRGPAPSGFSLLPWLLMGMGSLSNLFQGETVPSAASGNVCPVDHFT